MGPTWCTPLPTEGAIAYQAFRIYRDLAPTERSPEEPALLLDNVSGDQAYTWCEMYVWQERALAYDVYRDRRRIERRETVAHARAALEDREGSLGLMFLHASEGAAERLARDSRGIAPRDAIQLGNAGLSLLSQGKRVVGAHELGDRLADKLTPKELDTLLEFLERADIDLDQV